MVLGCTCVLLCLWTCVLVLGACTATVEVLVGLSVPTSWQVPQSTFILGPVVISSSLETFFNHYDHREVFINHWLFRCKDCQWKFSELTVAKVAPQEGKPVKAAAPQGAPAGCRRRSGKEGVRALSKTGDPLRAGRASSLAATVAGRLLPVLPHDPGPAVDPKNKVEDGRTSTKNL